MIRIGDRGFVMLRSLILQSCLGRHQSLDETLSKFWDGEAKFVRVDLEQDEVIPEERR
jgi:hypothetical protein